MTTTHSRDNILNYFSLIIYAVGKLNEGTLSDLNGVPQFLKKWMLIYFPFTCILNAGVQVRYV